MKTDEYVSSLYPFTHISPSQQDPTAWWRHQMETFSALLALCAGNSPVTDEFPSQMPVTQSFDVFNMCLNKRLSKQSWGWCFETPSHPLWRHCNEINVCNNHLLWTAYIITHTHDDICVLYDTHYCYNCRLDLWTYQLFCKSHVCYS